MNPNFLSEPSEGSRIKTAIESRRNHAGFGSRTTRFDNDPLTITPGVGSYNTFDETSLVLKSPSLSKKGYGNSFVSKSPKLSAFTDTRGFPGPNSYSIHNNSIATPSDSLLRPSSAFLPCGNGRVPFPPPNKVPGPNSYEINPDPGSPKLMKYKKSSMFLTKTKRNSFLRVNDIPGIGKYTPNLLPYSGSNADIVWSKGSFTRFQDLGKDNKVPGPQRYFDPDREANEAARKTLRTSGTYRGRYIGKQSEKEIQNTTTFGADMDRFKHSAMGRLDLIAQLPGPGAYFQDLEKLSSISPVSSPRRPLSPVKSPKRATSPPISPSKSILLFIKYINFKKCYFIF